MSITHYAVKPLFAEPYFMADISHAITEEQVAFLKSLPMVKNQENYISEDLYIFRLPELKSIADAVQEALDIYAREVMGISQRLYVTQSWTLMNPPPAWACMGTPIRIRSSRDRCTTRTYRSLSRAWSSTASTATDRSS